MGSFDQLQGLKHPGDDAARATNANYTTTVTPVSGWPVVESGLSDQIYADFEIQWQHNGHSVGNVAIRNTHANDALAWGLEVKATINNDATVYQGDVAAMRVSFHYRFSRTLGSDAIALRDFVIYGNGAVSENSRWTQRPGRVDVAGAGARPATGGALAGAVITEIASPMSRRSSR